MQSLIQAQFTGIGYVQHISLKGKEWAVSIFCEQPAQGQREAINFECSTADTNVISALNSFSEDYSQGQGILVRFAAIYQATVNLLHCQKTEDPDHIVTIRVKLMTIEKMA